MHDYFNISEFLKDLILPPVCVICGSLSPLPLCSLCAGAISFFGNHVCLQCGKPFKSDMPGNDGFDKNISSSKICDLCKNEDYHFYKARSFSLYEGKLAELIRKYKYKKYYYLNDILAGFLERAYKLYYSWEKLDYVDTVPNYNTYRGFDELRGLPNHMQILAKRFSEKIRIPFADNILKIRKTQQQQMLDRNHRIINQADAFKVKDCLKVHGKNFLILDDVWTTGSTLNEISITLKKAGAGRICLLTLARGA